MQHQSGDAWEVENSGILGPDDSSWSWTLTRTEKENARLLNDDTRSRQARWSSADVRYSLDIRTMRWWTSSRSSPKLLQTSSSNARTLSSSKRHRRANQFTVDCFAPKFFPTDVTFLRRRFRWLFDACRLLLSLVESVVGKGHIGQLATLHLNTVHVVWRRWRDQMTEAMALAEVGLVGHDGDRRHGWRKAEEVDWRRTAHDDSSVD